VKISQELWKELHPSASPCTYSLAKIMKFGQEQKHSKISIVEANFFASVMWAIWRHRNGKKHETEDKPWSCPTKRARVFILIEFVRSINKLKAKAKTNKKLQPEITKYEPDWNKSTVLKRINNLYVS
jgi:hypothetical protein